MGTFSMWLRGKLGKSCMLQGIYLGLGFFWHVCSQGEQGLQRKCELWEVEGCFLCSGIFYQSWKFVEPYIALS